MKITHSLIGITGKKRSGKDTVGDYLKEQFGYSSYAFADPVKQTAQVMFGLTNDEMDNDNKEAVIKRWGFSYRQMLQIIGTDCGRNMFRDDIWILRAQDELDKIKTQAICNRQNKNYVVVTDCRFNNEAELIKNNGGIVICIERDTEYNDTHSSESGVDNRYIDYHVKNDGTIDELHQQIETILGNLNVH